MDLRGDEELEALRKVALASLKAHSKKKDDTASTVSEKISTVSTLITAKSSDHQTDQTQGPMYGSQQSWRNSQSSRRGRGRQFPKGNQRSNLIVITPVNLNKDDEQEAVPQFILPQHKRCQSANEDSSSPKSYRRTGPTRFNRHGSDSESSEDSDYDHSDNDSFSNDTVLQDEPPETLSSFTQEDNTEDETVVKKQETTLGRQLSFHNIDSQQKETEDQTSRSNVYNSLEEETETFRENDSKLDNESSVNQHNVAPVSDERVRSHSPIKFQEASTLINGGSHSKNDNEPRSHKPLERDSYKISRKYAEKCSENDAREDSTLKDQRNRGKNLTEGDLRFELKKRMQEKPLNAVPSRNLNDSYDLNRATEQNRNHIRSRHSHTHQDSDEHDQSFRRKSSQFRDRKNQRQNRSSSENEPSTSPKRNHVNYNHSKISSRLNQQRKRERSHSSDRNSKRSRSQSPDQQSTVPSRGGRRHSGSSSSSSTSSSSCNSKSSNTSPRLRLVSSVVKPVARTAESKTRSSVVSEKGFLASSESGSALVSKRKRDSDEKLKVVSSAVKSSICGNEKLNNAADGVKRVPVHMRLGTLPHKRIIRMTKDVEAAFVSTSSDEDNDLNTKLKKQNFRVVAKLTGNQFEGVAKRHVKKSACRNIDVFKGRRMKLAR